MHADEVATSVALVRGLLADQFPEWAALPVAPVASAGTDNAIYRLGSELAVRLPRLPGAVAQVEKEQRWLPRLARLLPLAVPVPLALGQPGRGYPWSWSVYRWLDGRDATAEPITDLRRAAVDLARFVATMWSAAFAGEAPAGRGRQLAERDGETRQALEALRGTMATERAAAAWQACLRAPAWNGQPVWTHGDLIPTNLLVSRGRLSGVIDFGLLGLGDPALDLIPAWSVLTEETRPLFRAALAVDEAAWQRGRGWALSQALIILPYYRDTNPVLVAVARRMITELLAGQADG